MNPRTRIACVSIAMFAGQLTLVHRSNAHPPVSARVAKTHTDYLLGCGGCHGENGVSNSRLVPDLLDQVGYFMSVPQGREYLVRLPNVAFSTLSDQELADVLNFAVFTIGRASVPPGTAAYSSVEVNRLRRRPLNEVSLLDYRSQLIETLIARHGATPRLRTYGSDHY